jgi:hypothetical protein
MMMRVRGFSVASRHMAVHAGRGMEDAHTEESTVSTTFPVRDTQCLSDAFNERGPTIILIYLLTAALLRSYRGLYV